MKALTMDRNDTVCVLVDFQEKIARAMDRSSETEEAIVHLVKGLRIMNVPIIVTTQYARGLGATTPAVSEALGPRDEVDKRTFSCMADESFREALAASGKHQILLCGIETHVCVQQTALHMIGAGYQVFLAEDACSSRKRSDFETALERMRDAGVTVTTGESALFELLYTSKAPEFREISALVK